MRTSDKRGEKTNFGVKSKEDRLRDGESGVVDVVLLVVDDLSSVPLRHVGSGDSAVRHISVDRHVAASLVGDGLEEGGATARR